MENSLTQLMLALVGLIVSMGGVLIWLIHQQNAQITTLTDRFVSTLETLVTKNTEAQVAGAGTMAQLAGAVAAQSAHCTEEHRAILDSVTVNTRAIMDGLNANTRALMDAIGKLNVRSGEGSVR